MQNSMKNIYQILQYEQVAKKQWKSWSARMGVVRKTARAGPMVLGIMRV